jgi:hypothetical protein
MELIKVEQDLTGFMITNLCDGLVAYEIRQHSPTDKLILIGGGLRKKGDIYHFNRKTQWVRYRKNRPLYVNATSFDGKVENFQIIIK